MVRSRGRDRGARRLAWEILWRTHADGAYPDLLLTSRLRGAGSLAKADRALASELVFGTLRWQSSLDLALGRVCQRPVQEIDPKLLVLLRSGAYQILFLHRIPPSAAVNESVEMARAIGLAHATSFVNGILRSVARAGKALLAVDADIPLAERIALETSHPLWMVERWVAQWGEGEARSLCEANNEVPPVTLRANTLRTSRKALALTLQDEGVRTEATQQSPDGLRVLRLPVPMESLRAFQRGEFQVQDEASQLMALWLAPSPGETILDACSAPGGKATHLAQLMEDRGKVVAVDAHWGRLDLIRRTCHRLGLTCVETRQEDLTDPGAIPAGPFDRILLDAPCTGLGVIRRHPDTKWRRAPEDPQRLAAIQISMMKNLIPALRPGGILLYSVCTHTPEETQGILEQILPETHSVRLLTTPDGLSPEAHSLVGPDGLFRSFPHKHRMDGFTAFRLQRV